MQPVTLTKPYSPKPPGSTGFGGSPGEKLLKEYKRLRDLGKSVDDAIKDALRKSPLINKRDALSTKIKRWFLEDHQTIELAREAGHDVDNADDARAALKPPKEKKPQRERKGNSEVALNPNLIIEGGDLTIAFSQYVTQQQPEQITDDKPITLVSSEKLSVIEAKVNALKEGTVYKIERGKVGEDFVGVLKSKAEDGKHLPILNFDPVWKSDRSEQVRLVNGQIEIEKDTSEKAGQLLEIVRKQQATQVPARNYTGRGGYRSDRGGRRDPVKPDQQSIRGSRGFGGASFDRELTAVPRQQITPKRANFQPGQYVYLDREDEEDEMSRARQLPAGTTFNFHNLPGYDGECTLRGIDSQFISFTEGGEDYSISLPLNPNQGIIIVNLPPLGEPSSVESKNKVLLKYGEYPGEKLKREKYYKIYNSGEDWVVKEGRLIDWHYLGEGYSFQFEDGTLQSGYDLIFEEVPEPVSGQASNKIDPRPIAIDQFNFVEINPHIKELTERLDVLRSVKCRFEQNNGTTHEGKLLSYVVGKEYKDKFMTGFEPCVFIEPDNGNYRYLFLTTGNVTITPIIKDNNR